MLDTLHLIDNIYFHGTIYTLINARRVVNLHLEMPYLLVIMCGSSILSTEATLPRIGLGWITTPAHPRDHLHRTSLKAVDRS